MQLARPEDYVLLRGLVYGLRWICCACLTVNKPDAIVCECGKQRYKQLGLTRRDAYDLANQIER